MHLPYLVRSDRIHPSAPGTRRLFADGDPRWTPFVALTDPYGVDIRATDIEPDLDDAVMRLVDLPHQLGRQSIGIEGHDAPLESIVVHDSDHAAAYILEPYTLGRLASALGSDFLFIGIATRTHLVAVNGQAPREQLFAFSQKVARDFLRAGDDGLSPLTFVVRRGEIAGTLSSAAERVFGQARDVPDDESAREKRLLATAIYAVFHVTAFAVDRPTFQHIQALEGWLEAEPHPGIRSALTSLGTSYAEAIQQLEAGGVDSSWRMIEQLREFLDLTQSSTDAAHIRRDLLALAQRTCDADPPKGWLGSLRGRDARYQTALDRLNGALG